MRTRSTPSATLIATTMLAAALMGGTSMLVPTTSYANEVGGKDHVTTAANKLDKTEQNLMKLSEDGHSAMRAVRGARIAIFNGEPEMATKMLEEAKNALDAAEKEAPHYAVKTDVSVDGAKVDSTKIEGSVDLIPIDAEMSVADSFMVTPEKQDHVDKANEHFKNGDEKEAITELKLGEIDVTYLRVLMPLTATKKHVETAMAFEKAHKYYEANLALKAAEDGLIVDTVSLIDFPADDTATKSDG